jgi:hypothetical protein
MKGLETLWLPGTDHAGIAERRHREMKSVKGDRTGGSPIAPTGVPKGDHVAEPGTTT